MDYTIGPKIDSLNRKIDTAKSQLTESMNRKEKILTDAITQIKSDVNNLLANHVTDFNKTLDNYSADFKLTKDDFSSKYDRLKLDLREYQDAQDKQNSNREVQMFNYMESVNDKIDKIHFDIIDNHDNIAITYVNPTGKVEYGAIKKVLPDNKTLSMDKDNKLFLKYNFDKNNFNIADNNIKVIGLSTNDGKILSAGQIVTDLNNANYNISSLTYKLEKILSKINNSNGYIAANNFKKADPSQDQLNQFAISCLSTSELQFNANDVPGGTKIKNLFDNHIWVLNRIIKNGLTTQKWEDFGSDNICIANNHGVHGLVTGSQNRLEGYIDITGTISINGLQEELTSLKSSIEAISTDFKEYKLSIDTRLSDIDKRLQSLER